jgi:hypothetical protein
MSEEDDPTLDIFVNIFYFVIMLAILFIMNLYFAFVNPGTGFTAGYNKIISAFVGIFILSYFFVSYLIITLPDTEDDVSLTLAIGMLFPMLLIVIYACIAVYNYLFKLAGSVSPGAASTPGLTPVATGGGRRKRNKK